jgi:hypothetical protein
MSIHEQWEYMTMFCYANINNEGTKEYIKQTFPNWKDPPIFSPQTMVPDLNSWGTEGWELVHMEPVASVGKNGDVGFITGEGRTSWSNIYFCVFKRRTSVET